MTKDYDPTPEQRKAIQAAVDASIMPLIRQVLIKKLGQAAVFMKEEIDARYQPLSDGEIYTAYIEATNQTLRPQDERLALAFARVIERHVRGV